MKKKTYIIPVIIIILISCIMACFVVHVKSEPEKNSVESTVLPEGDYQARVSFPDWAGYTDKSLAMNSMYNFTMYHGQGVLYVSPGDNIRSFRLFVNGNEVETGSMTGGGTYAVDIASLTVDGSNTLQVSGMEPAEPALQPDSVRDDESRKVTVCIPYPVVTEAPDSKVIDKDVLATIDDIISSDIEYGFTSAQLAVVKDGALVYHDTWGKTDSYNKDGSPFKDASEADDNTLYDLASNTKMYSVVYALMHLMEQGKFNPEDRVTDILGRDFVDKTIEIPFASFEGAYPGLDTIKEWKSRITMKQLLCHKAGFPPSGYYNMDKYDMAGDEHSYVIANELYVPNGTRKKTLEEGIYKTPLMYEPGTGTVYSDIDYMLLGAIIEKLTGESLDSYLSKTYWEPMNLERITFNPLDHGFTKEDCAATELNGNSRDGLFDFPGARTETVWGEVHDELAYYSMDGISGHAGLFSNATDLAKLASVMLSGGYGNHKFFSKTVRDLFISPQSVGDANYGLGWWREGEYRRVKYFATQSPTGTVGHQGWTGTLTMIDFDNNLVIVLLTNKKNTALTYRGDITRFNVFNGDYYTTSTMGWLPQLVYLGLGDNKNTDEQLDSLMLDMIAGKNLLAAAEGDVSADHPAIRSRDAIVSAARKRAERTGDRIFRKQIDELLTLSP